MDDDMFDVDRLHNLCVDIPKNASSLDWDPIRQWLMQSDQDLVARSLKYKDDMCNSSPLVS